MANEYKQGEHICAFYGSDEELLETAATYVADGLRAARRCLLVAASPQVHARVRRRLSRHGVDVSNVLRTRSLLEGLHADVHLVDGGFNTERMLRFLNDGIETALNDGFSGLRCCGDMSWLLQFPSAHRQVFEYEALLNALFRSTPAEAMGLYPTGGFPPEWMARARHTHTSSVIDGVDDTVRPRAARRVHARRRNGRSRRRH